MNVSGQQDFSSFFDWAVVRVATYVPGAASNPRLLFGSVSIIARDRPRPSGPSSFDSFKVGKGRNGKVFVRRMVLQVGEALDWYRSEPSKKLLTPVPSDAEDVDEQLDGKPLTPTQFVDDPEWPKLGVPTGSDSLFSAGGPGDPAPFVGGGSGSARIHRRFGNGAEFESVTADPEAVRFLKRRLHVDLADYSEYLGGLALIVPDPILRGIQHYVIPGGEDKPEQLIYRLIPRAGQSVASLSLTILERRSNLLSRFETVEVPDDGLVVAPRMLPIEASGYVITDPRLGVLAYQTPLPFLRHFNVSVGVANRRVKVAAPKTDSSRAADASYEVMEYAQDRLIGAGETVPPLNLNRVFAAEARRERKTQARRYEQTWIEDGDRNAALEFVRGRIGRARTSVVVADPYFGARQTVQFLQAVSRIDVALTILTSKWAFQGPSADGHDSGERDDDLTAAIATELSGPPGATKSSTETRRLNEFSNAMVTFDERGIKNVSALVLVGRVPLHDRFLIVDNTVWFLGNSLNALGVRASLILQVPDGEPIIDRVSRMKAGAMPFEKYAQRRLATIARRLRTTPRQ